MNIKGFTLIELLIVLSLAGILAGLCLANSNALWVKNEKQIFLDEVRDAVQHAKIQALSLGTPVFLSPLDPKHDWSKGMQLQVFNKKTKTLELLQQWQWQHAQWTLEWVGSYASDKIVFASNPRQAMSNGRLVFTHQRTKEQEILVLNRLGRVYGENSSKGPWDSLS